MKKLLVLLAAVAVMAGCNTISGAGKDVEAAGRAIDKAAQDTKKKL
jgi:predicted small secreted protein